MTTKQNELSRIHSGMRFMATGTSGWQRPGPVFEADDGTGEGEGGESDPPAKKPEAKSENKPSDDAAKLLKEVMALKAKVRERDETLSKFKDVDPEAFKTLLSEKAERDAEKAKAEEDRLKAAGDFETLKTSMAAEHARQLKEIKDARAADMTAFQKAQSTIEELTVGQAFAASAFLQNETVLTATKARKVYGAHFDIEDGAIKPYDKERGESGRTPLVKATGEPLSFDEAMERIVKADPERDRLLKSTKKPGSGQQPAAGKPPSGKTESEIAPGMSRILAGLANLKPSS